MLARTALLYIALGIAPQFVLAQEIQTGPPGGSACVELTRLTEGRAAAGSDEVATVLSGYLRGGANPAEVECAGIVFSVRAAFMAVSGNIPEAELDAERSLTILGKSHARDDRVLMRPLHTLAFVRLEQGKTVQARQVYRRMQLIRTDLAEDRTLVHGMAAMLLGAAGKLKEAESEYSAALSAIDDEGRGGSAEVASILGALASVYIEDHQFDEARRALDRAMTIINAAKDTVAMDRILLLATRGVLHARQRQWLDAEPDMREALSIADREKVPDSMLAKLLPDYAMVLRKIHRRKEARSIEARAAAFCNRPGADALVDVTDLSAESRPRKK
jgi:tetratricopeptide (TPR) repeat protein